MHWFALVESERSEVLSNSICDKNYFDKLYKSKLYLINLIGNSIETEKYFNPSNQIGMTMNDGGQVLDNWSLILGSKIYKSFLEDLFY